MKIREIRCAGLRGATPEGGWSNELRPEDCVHTLIVVHTDDGDVVITDACLMYEHIERMVPLGTADSLEACLNGFMVVRQAGQFILPLYDPLAMERREAWRVG